MCVYTLFFVYNYVAMQYYMTYNIVDQRIGESK